MAAKPGVDLVPGGTATVDILFVPVWEFVVTVAKLPFSKVLLVLFVRTARGVSGREAEVISHQSDGR